MEEAPDGVKGDSGSSGVKGDSGSSGVKGGSGSAGVTGGSGSSCLTDGRLWQPLTDGRLWQLLTDGRLWQAGETYRRPGAWRSHRMYQAVGEHWSSGAQPWHHSSRLDDHSRMALAGGWPIAHQAMSAYWQHRALNRITRCLTSTALLPVSTGSWLRSIA